MLGGKYLRIRTPQTVDGVNLKYTEEGKIVYKETDAPLTAKPHLERENADYEQVGKPHLKHIITEISEDTPLYTGRKTKTREEMREELKKELLEDMKASGFVITQAPEASDGQATKPTGKKKTAVAVDEDKEL